MTDELQHEVAVKLQQRLGAKTYDFLGYTVNLETGELTDHLGSNNQMLANTIETLLNHYADGKPSPLTGKLVKYRDFPGGCAYEEAFVRRAMQPIVDVFGENPKEIVEVAARIGGKPLTHGDASVEIIALKGIPLIDGDPEGGKKGLKAARSIALLSYRNSNTYNKTQAEDADEKTSSFKAASYQDHQGDKLVKRFNPYSYYCIVNMSDTHNIGRGRGGAVKALKSIKAKTLCIGITSDLLFPVHEQKLVAEHVSDAKYSEIDSFYGHDGFLIESDIITKVIREFWNNNQKN
jgi:hypothetical protein